MNTMTKSRWFATALLAMLALPASAQATPPAPTFTSKARLFLPDVVSTPYSEVRATVSPDGRTVLWGSTNRPGGAGGWDIWMTRKIGDDWTAPAAVSFDTPHNEFDPAFSADGRYVYFFSNRPGGFGGDDIYRVAFDAAGTRFGAAQHLGAAVNSAGNEWAPTPSPDGTQLLFATDGRGGAGRHDLFVSELRDGAWQPARALPGEVNSTADDFDAAFIAGGRGLVFARSDNVDEAPIALWFAARGADGRYLAPVKLDGRINVAGGGILGPVQDLSDPHRLLFSGQRPDSNRGRADIYSIYYEWPD